LGLDHDTVHGAEPHKRELILFIGFLSISISMTGMWPVTPVTSMAYYVGLWTAFSYALWMH
jgi:hypothetical protein